MIVYWCNKDLHSNKEPMTGLRRTPPKPVRRLLNNKYNVRETHSGGEVYYKCPAHLEHIKNLYSINSPFDCDLIVEQQPDQPEFATSTFFSSNEQFDDAFFVRSIKNRLFSLNVATMFLSETDDLIISQMPAYLESNGFVDNTVIIPGTFNVGKWPRALECAFHLKENRMSVFEGEPLFYVKFHTDEKIVFKEFLYTEKMRKYVHLLVNSRKFKFRPSKMDFFYNLFTSKNQLKKRMLEEAKANVIGESNGF